MTYQKYRLCCELAGIFGLLPHVHSTYFMLWYTQMKSWTAVPAAPLGRTMNKTNQCHLISSSVFDVLSVIAKTAFRLTCAGRFLDQFGVVSALGQSAVGARSIQQGVHSHSNIFRQVKLGAVRPPRRPDSLPIRNTTPLI